MRKSDLRPPLPEIPEGSDRDTMVELVLHVTSISAEAWYVKQRFSEKRSVKLYRDYAVRLRGGNQWKARFQVPVWLYRRIRDRL